MAKKKPKINKDRSITFYTAMPSYLYYNGSLYQVSETIAKCILEEGYKIVKEETR